VGRAVARIPVPGSRGFWLVLAVLGVTLAALRLGMSDTGQAFLVRYGISRHFAPQVATRVDVAIAEKLLALGLVRGDVKARDVAVGGRRVREYTFASPAHLTPTLVQMELRHAVRDVHGEIIRAAVTHDKGEALVLALGFGSLVTHRIVIKPPLPPPMTAQGPRRPRLALIIDDLGHNMNGTTRGILDLGVPFTVAVLPELRKSNAVLEAARKRGLPALLHLPMQPAGDENPGKHPVTVDMPPEKIDALVGKHASEYKTIIGVNNHMGSLATTDVPTMRALMQSLRKRELVFVDSQTSPRSVGRRMAREAGVWCIANDLFLDDKEEPVEQVEANLQRLANLARRRGLAVGIGHPHPETLAALRVMLPRLQAHGIDFVTIDSLRPQPNVAVRTDR
jgi:uncharacterized protein